MILRVGPEYGHSSRITLNVDDKLASVSMYVIPEAAGTKLMPSIFNNLTLS